MIDQTYRTASADASFAIELCVRQHSPAALSGEDRRSLADISCHFARLAR